MARSPTALTKAGRPPRQRQAPSPSPLPSPAAAAAATAALPPAKSRWCVYVLRCRDATLYCGITNDLPRRIAQHNRGQGARYTRGRGPVVLLKSWRAASQSAALKAEWAFKALSRAEKERRLAPKNRSAKPRTATSGGTLPESTRRPRRRTGGRPRAKATGTVAR